MHQVVDLGPAGDVRLPDAGAVNAGVGLYFHIVLQYGRSGLDDLAPAPRVVPGKTEAIAANPGMKSVELDVENQGNPLVDYLKPLLRLLTSARNRGTSREA